MRIFNLADKTKYIAALALLLAFAVFIFPAHAGEPFEKQVKPDFPVKSNAFFDYTDIYTTCISPVSIKLFGRNEGIKGIKQRHSNIRQTKILPVSKFVLGKYINNVYAAARASYYTEVCKLLEQLIIIYIFMKDGKKRTLKLSWNHAMTNEISI